jgi:predicted nuclease of predicted toxin-antitoxin system
VRLLFDENLSHHLVELLANCYRESTHVRDVGLGRADDEAVWNYAAARGLTIVSKDSDFHQRSLLYGPPPKVVWTSAIVRRPRLSEYSGAISRTSRCSNGILPPHS